MDKLERKIRILLWLFFVGLIAAGVTAIPLVREVQWLCTVTGVDRVGPHAG